MVGGTSDVVITPLLMKGSGYDHKSFVPVALLVRSPMALLARRSLQASSLDEVLQLARDTKTRMSIGVGGNHGLGAFAAKALERACGVEFLPIPYNGAAPAMLALLREEVDLGILPLSVVQQHLRATTIRVLALLTREHLSQTPTLPVLAESMQESGVEFWIWAAVVGPHGLPIEIVDTINRTVRDIVEDPHFGIQRRAMGEFVAPAMLPHQVEEFIESEHRRYSALAVGRQRHHQ
jgi:tripartite-type tricarboxylate transporter receptor subunit TctC